MAEIRVEPKRRSLVWLWLLLALAVLALVGWYLVSSGTVRTTDGTGTGPTALAAPAAPAAAVAAGPAPAA